MNIYDSRNYSDEICESLRGHYQILRLPFRKTVKALNPEEAEGYFEWFLSEIPIRSKILLEAIRIDDETVNKHMDYTPESLISLGQWLPKHVHTLKRDPIEMQREIERPGDSFRSVADQVINRQRWSSETVSLCYDIGIYFNLDLKT